jgi:hypothetical protein
MEDTKYTDTVTKRLERILPTTIVKIIEHYIQQT